MQERRLAMNSRAIELCAVLVCLSMSTARPQDSITIGFDTPPGDRSSNQGKPVDHPEALSGVWEDGDGRGGAVGIHMELYTSVSVDTVPPLWLPQSWQGLNLGVFHRAGAGMRFGEEGYFEPVILEGDHLQLHFASSRAQIPSVDLDLVRQSDGCWHGRFHRGDFDSMVALCRPAPGSGVTPDPLVGTWLTNLHGCLHIYQTGPSTFTGWTDALEVPGDTLFSANDRGPHKLPQSYGILAKVEREEGGEISVEMDAFTGFCCPHLFRATLSADGRTLYATYPSGPNHVAEEATWTKVPGESCVDPAAIRKIQRVECPPQKPR
jgi:hypothetical protein